MTIAKANECSKMKGTKKDELCVLAAYNIEYSTVASVPFLRRGDHADQDEAGRARRISTAVEGTEVERMELTRDDRIFLGIVHDPEKREQLMALLQSWDREQKGEQHDGNGAETCEAV